jgi:hypothetical protein
MLRADHFDPFKNSNRNRIFACTRFDIRAQPHLFRSDVGSTAGVGRDWVQCTVFNALHHGIQARRRMSALNPSTFSDYLPGSLFFPALSSSHISISNSCTG